MNQMLPQTTSNTQIDTSVPLTKGQVFKILSEGIPFNSYQLPDYIYRADLIPQELFTHREKERSLILDSATLPITFEHGYPSITHPNTNAPHPLWERLPAESEDAFAVFMSFLELPEKSNGTNPIRLLPLIAEITSRPLTQIAEWCHVFFWHARSRAYDLFLLAALRKQREQRMMTIEGHHFTLAEGFLNKVQQLADKKLDKELRELDEDPDADTETKLSDLIKIADTLVSIQRVAIGLPKAGPERLHVEMDGPRHTTVAETFKHIAKEGAGVEAPSRRSTEMDTLLSSQEDLTAIQSLLIRVQRPTHQLPDWSKDAQTIDVTPNND
jgi:hypothetical protein